LILFIQPAGLSAESNGLPFSRFRICAWRNFAQTRKSLPPRAYLSRAVGGQRHSCWPSNNLSGFRSFISCRKKFPALAL